MEVELRLLFIVGATVIVHCGYSTLSTGSDFGLRFARRAIRHFHAGLRFGWEHGNSLWLFVLWVESYALVGHGSLSPEQYFESV